MPPNLKIARDDSVLHVVDSFHPMRIALSLLSLLVVAGMVAHEWMANKHPGEAPRHMLELGSGLVVFLAFWSRRDFEFDKSAQKLTRRCKLAFRSSGGEMPFENITDAALEPKKFFLARGRNNTGRLVLRTRERTITVCDYYSTRSQTRCEEVAARIREVLRNPKA